ncbi:neuronal acetylcholine receptor subunit alpha-10-like [Branchiostoma floridae]|uniref:Neuronal acetylcholine receptor subunit alpha-10-like n=1 Tax=Branchiostoma floridae TaxID=7739 RepID=A0A9J7MKP9_BRAFL|nr:neuronal acetylcholine receptor subunit alpha-10-like [Branchiostoma floridae]
MKTYVALFVLVCRVVIQSVIVEGTNSTEEKALIKVLMSNYTTGSRPVRNSMDTVTVTFDIALGQIIDVISKDRVMITNLWVRQYWRDEYLVWDPSNHGDLRAIRIPSEQIWRPDIVLYNRQLEEDVVIPDTNAAVTYEGDVTWLYPITLKSSCILNVEQFPNDEQRCDLQFGSWTYDGFAVDLINKTATGDTSSVIENEEWKLLDMTAKRTVAYYNCCPEPYPDVTYTVRILRRSLYYYYYLVAPSLILVLLTLISFQVPPDCEEKLTVSVTMLLSVVFYQQLLADRLPAHSGYIPILGRFFAATMFTVSLSSAMVIFVMGIHFHGPNARPVPPWLRRIALRSSKKQAATSDTDMYPSNSEASLIPTNQDDEDTDVDSNKKQALVSEECELTNRRKPLKTRDSGFTSMSSSASSVGSQTAEQTTAKVNTEEEKLLAPLRHKLSYAVRLFRQIVHRSLKKDKRIEISEDWKLVAIFVDKCLLVIFVIIATITTTAILV